MTAKEQQTLTADDVGDASKVVSTASAAEAFKPETALETLTRVRDTLVKTRRWAGAKADTVERRIREAGGEPTKEARELLAEIRAAGGDTLENETPTTQE